MSVDSATYGQCSHASPPLHNGNYAHLLAIRSFNWFVGYAFWILGSILDVRNAAMNNNKKRQNPYFHGSDILAGKLGNKYINR